MAKTPVPGPTPKHQKRLSGGRKDVKTGAVSIPSSDSESIRIRSISNGFLICRDGVRKGKYFSEEEYTPSKPVLTAAVEKPVKGKR